MKSEIDSPPSLLPSSEIPEIDEDVFLGSIVINPLECGPAIIQKCLEADAIASESDEDQVLRGIRTLP